MLNAVADLTACDREPITALEHIQGFGFPLALAEDWTIVRASANLRQYLDTDALQAIGMQADRVVAKTALRDVRNRVVALQADNTTERLFGVRLGVGDRLFDLALHYAGKLLVIEGEPCGDDQPAGAAILVRSMTARLQAQPTMTSFYRDAARQIRTLTGFDRTMIYRFAEDGTGEVIAESVKGRAESWLGLHYPASDIPIQARALYLRVPFRIIADVGAETVALLPPTSDKANTLDLSFAVTRAVSPVHIEYLVNMGVGASMSISIIINGRLWGLVACHHHNARLPSFVTRSAAELFGAMLSLTLESRLHALAVGKDEAARDLGEHVIAAVGSDPARLSDAPWMLATIGNLIACDGAAVFLRGQLTLSGSTPDPAEVRLLAARLNRAPAGRVFDVDCLTALLPDAEHYARRTAGLMAIPMSRTPRDYLMLFRKERIEDRRWAGDPNDKQPPAAMPADGDERISPRKSFAAFVELTRNHSLPFDDTDRRVAETLRSALVESALLLTEGSPPEAREASGRQEVLIAELNHRVRNILALIRGLIAQTNAEGVDTAEYVVALGGRVQALARAHDQVTRKNWSPAPITSLFDDEIAAFLPGQRERLLISGPAVLLQPTAFSTLALVVHELVTNSLKYGALSGKGVVAVVMTRGDDGGLHISWREANGPPVTQPLRRGFGSVIVERTIPFDLGGTAEARYPSQGFEADFFLPEVHIAGVVDLIVATAMPDMAETSSGKPILRPLEGRSALVLEDNFIVALETESILYDLGAMQVWTAGSVAEADAIVADQQIDFAILDINIGEDYSTSFAKRLHAAQIPYFFASGYGDDAGLGAIEMHAVIVRKPYGLTDVRHAAISVLGSSAQTLPHDMRQPVTEAG